MLVKSYGLIEKRKALSEGEVEFVVSTGALDAHGEKVDVDGISLKEYKNNSVVLWGHDGFSLPIAKTLKIWKSDGKLLAKTMFDLSDDFARKVYNKIKGGYLNAVSIGGMVDEWGDDGITIKKMNMKEFSVVSIPANPEALVVAKSYGITKEDIEQSDKELTDMTKQYAERLLNDKSELIKEIDRLETLVATFKGLVESETDKDSATDKKDVRVKLRMAQAVDQQTERIIVKLKERK